MGFILLQSAPMKEKDSYFAIVPIHGENKVVEGKTGEELQNGINQILQRTEESYPNHDFRAEITVIKGRKIKLPQ